MRYSYFALILSFLVLTSCTDNNDEKDAILVFGHFYGMCMGEECVEIFKVTNSSLREDSKDSYPEQDAFYKGKFEKISDTHLSQAQELISAFPTELLNEQKTVIGCPDCADGGGLYIEYEKDGIHKFWLIDRSKSNVPEYLIPFMDQVDSTIASINK